MARVFEPHITEYLRNHLSRGSVFVDVGANIGYYSVIAAALVGTSGRVLALEPEKFNFTKLAENVERNHLTQVTCIQRAATAQPGSVKLHLHPINDGGHSIVPLADSVHAQEVVGDRLDTLCAHALHGVIPDLIKIDVEGFELGVLTGMSGILSSPKHPDIICEVGAREKHELFALLATYGYRVYSMHGEGEVTADTHSRKRDYVFKHGKAAA